VFIWYIFSGFGIMYNEKSGNTGLEGGREELRLQRPEPGRRRYIGDDMERFS
jgi:hypothetical protein